MSRLYKRWTALASLALALLAAAGATTAQAEVTPAEATRQVERYFNAMTTLKAEFTQQVTGEPFAGEGTLYVSRPGKFLWQYDTPVRQKIVNTGSAVYYVDQERNQVTQLPMNAGVARLFNAKVVNLAKLGLHVVAVKDDPAAMTVTLRVDPKVFGEAQGIARMSMTFDKSPAGLQLRRFEAVDLTQVTTRVELRRIEAGVTFASDRFKFVPGVYREN